MNKCCIKEREKIIEELKEKIKNSKISMNIDTEYYDGCRYAIKEILKLLEE